MQMPSWNCERSMMVSECPPHLAHLHRALTFALQATERGAEQALSEPVAPSSTMLRTQTLAFCSTMLQPGDAHLKSHL